MNILDNITKPLTAFSVILLVSGCTTNGASNSKVALAEAKTQHSIAVSSNADEYARYALHQAQEKIESAGEAIKDGNFEKAQRLANEAALDARLAHLKAEHISSKTALMELEKTLQALKNELTGKTDL